MPSHTDLIAITLAQATPSTAQPPTSDQVIPAPAAPAGTTGQPGSTTAPSQQQGTGSSFTMLLSILLIVVLFMVMSSFTGRKDKKKRAQMMSSLGKGDKVITIGGQIGVVDQVRDNEVVLRVDENSNARARFTKAAIQQVLESAGGPADTTAPTVEVKSRNDKALTAK
jgi:preprotein translocase subunit YajC